MVPYTEALWGLIHSFMHSFIPIACQMDPTSRAESTHKLSVEVSNELTFSACVDEIHALYNPMRPDQALIRVDKAHKASASLIGPYVALSSPAF